MTIVFLRSVYIYSARFFFEKDPLLLSFHRFLSCTCINKKNSIPSDYDNVVDDINPTTNQIKTILCMMVYYTDYSDDVSSDSISGIISTRKTIKTTKFLLLQQQQKSFEGQTTINKLK